MELFSTLDGSDFFRLIDLSGFPISLSGFRMFFLFDVVASIAEMEYNQKKRAVWEKDVAE